MQELLAAGPSYVHSVLKQRLQEAGLTGDLDTKSSDAAADGQARQAGLACDPEACPWSRLCHSCDSELNPHCSQPESAPLHALAPIGCRQRVLQGTIGPACHGGISYLGTTGLAVGRHDALAAEVWQSIDAVLDCGEHPHPGWVAPPTYQSFVVCKCEYIADKQHFVCSS